ncbi:MAG: hypothetical protein AAF631_09965, partial [Pseudomonadota bacterium]
MDATGAVNPMAESEDRADTLNARLLAAHAAGDARTLVALYRQAGDDATDDTARGFYLTHAYVFALEAGDPFTRHVFTFRFLFGLALNAVFLWRGFALAAWTH